MCIETDRRHHEAPQCGNEYANMQCPSAVLAMSQSDKPSFLLLSCFSSPLLCCTCPSYMSCSLRQECLASAVSVASSSAVLALSCSVHQASLASCSSVVSVALARRSLSCFEAFRRALCCPWPMNTWNTVHKRYTLLCQTFRLNCRKFLKSHKILDLTNVRTTGDNMISLDQLANMGLLRLAPIKFIY